MREKYESLGLADLREIAKARGMKRISSLKKSELIELMLNEDDKDKAAGKDVEPKPILRGMKEPSYAAAASNDKGNKNERKEKPAREQKPNTENTEKAVKEPKQNIDNTREKPVREQKLNTENIEKAVKEPKQNTENINEKQQEDKFPSELDSGLTAHGILEVMPDGYGFIRSENFLPGESDVYVAPSQIRRFGLRTGDIIEGNTRIKTMNEKFSALLYLKKSMDINQRLQPERRKLKI